jgi:hypothetical protein
MYFHPLLPPLLGQEAETLRFHLEEIEYLLKKTPDVTVMVYDVIEEPSRTCPTERLTPRKRGDATAYLQQLQRGIGRHRVSWCLFRAVRTHDTLASLEEWYVQHYQDFDALVITGNHWNSAVKIEIVVPHLLNLALFEKKMGAVLIPHRPCEKERCLARQQLGISFFVTQLQLYPSPLWLNFVDMLGPAMVTLFTVPTSYKQLAFLETLGVCTQKYNERMDKPIQEKMDDCLGWLREPYGFDILVEKNRLSYLHRLFP